MKVLLTGGAGYIGSHIAVELMDSDFDVMITDNLSNSSIESIRRIEQISGKKAAFFELDMTDPGGVDSLFQKNRPDAVIHLAGLKAVGESIKEPLRYFRNNLCSTIALLEAMEKYDVLQLIFSSSATVYGVQDRLPYTEDMIPGVSSSPYGATKQMIERIISDTAANGRLSAIMLRYFNPVGAHMSGLIGESPRGLPNNLMPYIMQVATGKLPELSVFGNDYPTRDGTCIRDYIHVVDLAKGHVSALKYCAEYPGIEVFNLGTGHGYSVFDVIDTYERVNEVKIAHKIAPRRAGDLPELYADVSKAEKILGWKAELTLDDMCRDAHIYANS